MDNQTMDAFNQLLTTIQNVGIGTLAVTIIGMMVIGFILDQRNRARQNTTNSQQFERVMGMFANALNNQDSATAKAIYQTNELMSMNRASLDQNTEAFLQQRDYRGQVLDATKELTALQAKNNDLVAALRIDVSAWPKEVIGAIDRVDVNILSVVNGFGGLDENIRAILKLVENNPEDHRHVLEALSSLADAQTKIFELIDSRLPERAKTTTPTPLARTADDQGFRLAIEAKRKQATDEMQAVKPEDEPPKPPEAA